MPPVKNHHFFKNHGRASQLRMSQGAPELPTPAPSEEPQHISASFRRSRQSSSSSKTGVSVWMRAIALSRNVGNGKTSRYGWWLRASWLFVGLRSGLMFLNSLFCHSSAWLERWPWKNGDSASSEVVAGVRPSIAALLRQADKNETWVSRIVPRGGLRIGSTLISFSF